jgi:hypothetical protein
MAQRPLTDAAAESLLTRKEELAHAITGALYREMPELLEKYGQRGRGKCLEDMRYNLEHLAPAVALGEPALFSRYVAWLRDMLHSRGVPAREVGAASSSRGTKSDERSPPQTRRRPLPPSSRLV